MAAVPAYDVRCSLLEEGRRPLPQPRAMAPRLVPKPKRTNPPWIRAIRAFGNTACVLFIVFILAFMVPRSRDKDHLRLFGNCAITVLLSLGFPAVAYILTMDVDDQPQGASNA